MKTNLKKRLSFVLVLALLISLFAGLSAYAVSEEDGSFVYVNLSVDGEIMADKAGNLIAYYPIPLEEGCTINDIMTRLHAEAYGDGSAWNSFDDSGFTYVAGIWGIVNESNCGNIYLNNSDAPVSAATVLEDGDVLDVNGYSDGTNFQYYKVGLFDKKYIEVAAGEEIILNAQSAGLDLTAFSYTKEQIADTEVYINDEGSGKTTDAEGNITLSFENDGTYIINTAPVDTWGIAVCVVKVAGGETVEDTEEEIAEDPQEEETKDDDTTGISLTNQAIIVDGTAVETEAYRIYGNKYVKLRDVAYILNGSEAQFSTDYDAATRTVVIVTGLPYTPLGTEMSIGTDYSTIVVPSSQSVEIDGVKADLSAYIINGHNFFRLADLGAALGFDCSFDDTNKATINTAGETAEDTEVTEKTGSADEGDAIGVVYFFGVIDNDILTDTEGKEIVYYPISIYSGDTIADAITTLHKEAYGDGYAWGYEEHSSYGYVLNKLWGNDCGSMSYGGGLWTDFSEGLHCAPNDAAEDGMIIYLNNFTSSAGMHCRTGYFDKQYVELSAGESVTLTYNRCSGDGVVKPCTSAPVAINGESAGTTDSSASIELTFDAPGEYIVKGTGKDSYSCSVCYVVVK